MIGKHPRGVDLSLPHKTGNQTITTFVKGAIELLFTCVHCDQHPRNPSLLTRCLRDNRHGWNRDNRQIKAVGKALDHADSNS